MIIKYNEYIKESFSSPKPIIDWLDFMNIRNYTINKDLTVDVNGWVILAKKNLLDIPIQFGVVKGDFLCHDNKLTTLRGCPNEVHGRFICSNNFLKDLLFSPKIVTNYFWTTNNPLTSLKGYSISNLKQNINNTSFKQLDNKLKEDYFDDNLEDNPDLINLINFPVSDRFKDKWEHLYNANKFDLI